jgi:hypothetical protein
VQGQFQTTQACGPFEAVDAEQLRGPTEADVAVEIGPQDTIPGRLVEHRLPPNRVRDEGRVGTD